MPGEQRDGNLIWQPAALPASPTPKHQNDQEKRFSVFACVSWQKVSLSPDTRTLGWSDLLTIV